MSEDQDRYASIVAEEILELPPLTSAERKELLSKFEDLEVQAHAALRVSSFFNVSVWRVVDFLVARELHVDYMHGIMLMLMDENSRDVVKTMDSMAEGRGFTGIYEFYQLCINRDFTSKKNVRKFRLWSQNVGTKDELLSSIPAYEHEPSLNGEPQT